MLLDWHFEHVHDFGYPYIRQISLYQTTNKSSLVARKFARYNIEIATSKIGKIHFTNKCQLNEIGDKCFLSDQGNYECCNAVFGFAIRTHLLQKLLHLPMDVND